MQACADETAATLSSDPHLDTNSHGSLSLSYSLSKCSISSFTFMSCVSWDLRASASIRTARSSRTPSGCRGTLPEAPVVDLRDPHRYCHSRRSPRAEIVEPTTSAKCTVPLRGKPGKITSTHLAQPDDDAAVDAGRGDVNVRPCQLLN
jgi:hypothetical protein